QEAQPAGIQKAIDIRDNTPQYLGPDTLPILEVGHGRNQGPKVWNPLARENRSRRKHASKEESGQKEKETLMMGEPRTRVREKSGPPQRSTSAEASLFLVSQWRDKRRKLHTCY